MIDWRGLAANALWITGLALALGTFSYASWQASMAGEKLRARLGNQQIQLVFNLAGGLFSAGLAATARSLLETVLWSVLSVLFIVQIVVLARQKPASS